MRYNVTEIELRKIVDESLSIADICRKLNIRPVGGNYKTIKNKFKIWGIDTSHFTGAAWNVGDNFRPFGKTTPLNDILIKNSSYTNTYNLKNRLYNEGLKLKKCENCGIIEWNSKPISLELHHDNGDNMDNSIENLKILCPNCHSQTKTYRNKTKKSSRNEKRLKNYKLRVKTITKEKKISFCNLCGKENKKYDRKFCSYECVNKNKLIVSNPPNKEELVENLIKLKSYIQVGNFYGKSDKTIKKWCKKYNINKETN